MSYRARKNHSPQLLLRGAISAAMLSGAAWFVSGMWSKQAETNKIDRMIEWMNNSPDKAGREGNIGDRTVRRNTALYSMITATAFAKEEGIMDRGLLENLTAGQATAEMVGKSRMESLFANGIRANACDEHERWICAMGVFQIIPYTGFSAFVQMDIRGEFPEGMRPQNFDKIVDAVFAKAIKNARSTKERKAFTAQRKGWKDGKTSSIDPVVLEDVYLRAGDSSENVNFRALFLPAKDGALTELSFDGVDVSVDIGTVRNAYTAMWLKSTYDIPTHMSDYLVSKYGSTVWAYLGHQAGEGDMRRIAVAVYNLDHNDSAENRKAYAFAINKADPIVNPYLLREGAVRKGGAYTYQQILLFKDIVRAVEKKQGTSEAVAIMEQGITALIEGNTVGTCMAPLPADRSRIYRIDHVPQDGPYFCRMK